VQNRLKGQKCSGEDKIESELGSEIVCSLIKEFQALLAQHGVGGETVLTAFNEALLEISSTKIRNSIEELRSFMLGMVVWKIFARESSLWINPKTKAGHDVPLDLMVAAYSVWRNALNLAAKQGVDAAAAAEAFVQVTHATADRIVGGGRDKSSGEVRNARNYMFAAFMHLISRTTAKQGQKHTDYVDTDQWLAQWEFSDRGAFTEALESGVLCRELLNAMPPKARSVAIARYILGYSWEETAKSLGTSINAAQKALSSGIRNAFGVCMRELQKMGYHRMAEIESHLMKHNKKSRLRRKSRESHERR
jgi:DNA-directed RNA polymerase specialized sigma24 family protein